MPPGRLWSISSASLVATPLALALVAGAAPFPDVACADAALGTVLGFQYSPSYGPRFAEVGGPVHVQVATWNNGTGTDPGVVVGCSMTGLYLHVGSVTSPPRERYSAPADVAAGTSHVFEVPDFPAGILAGIQTITFELRQGDGGAPSPADRALGEWTVRFYVGHKPDLTIRDGPADVKGLELSRGGTRLDPDALVTDYAADPALVATAVMRNVGRAILADPSSLSQDGHVCTATGTKLVDGAETPDDTCTGTSRGIPFDVRFRLTPAAGAGTAPGGRALQALASTLPTQVLLPDTQCRLRDGDGEWVVRGHFRSYCFLNATASVDLRRAGPWRATAVADPGDAVPEGRDRGVNVYGLDLPVRGSDLVVDRLGFTVVDDDGAELPTCGLTPEAPCDPAIARIKLQGGFANVGSITAGGPGGAIAGETVQWRFEGDLLGIRPGEAETYGGCQGSDVTAWEASDCVLPPGTSSALLESPPLSPAADGALTVRLVPDVPDHVFEENEADNLGEITIYFAE